MRRAVLSVVLAGLALAPASAHENRKVTLASLLRQMTDLSLLAEFPDPPYATRQFSSYDRTSVAPGSEDWFANHDRGFMLYDGAVEKETPYFKTGPQQGRPPDGHFPAGTRVAIAPNRKPIGEYVWAYATAPDGGPLDGKIPQGFIARSAITPDPQGHVLAEMDGPGAVVRIWSPNPNDAGWLRIYLDGSEKPALDAPMEALLAGKWQTQQDGKQWTPFPDPVASEHSRGWNLYFPIAYQKHCKVTVEKPDIYYHVDYRTYLQGTEVEPFSLAAVASRKRDVAEVAKALAECRPTVKNPNRFWGVEGKSQTIKPGDKVLLCGDPKEPRPKGFNAIYRVGIQVRNRGDVNEALRGLVLVGAFDRFDHYDIWCPLGDFFGASPGVNPYQSLPFSVRRVPEKELPDTVEDKKDVVELVARWWMPFQSGAKLGITNLGRQPVEVVSSFVLYTPYEWTDRSLYFHAKWRTETMKTRPFRDWTFCDLKGKGVFVGDMLSVWNPVPDWWGEGDEKVFVDGEKFPSWFGTGSEDYFGYGWGDPHPFQHAYHNQTRCDGPRNQGHTSVNRFHVLDAIPFTKSFRFDLEVWHWKPDTEVNYAATSYWYARPEGRDDFPPLEEKVLRTVP